MVMSQCGGWSLGEGRLRSKYFGRLREINHTGETTSPEHVLGDTFGIAHFGVCVESKRKESGMFKERTVEAEELAGNDSWGTKPLWESSRVLYRRTAFIRLIVILDCYTRIEEAEKCGIIVE